MLALLARRAGSSLTSILILTALVFGISELTPGGPAYSILGIHATRSRSRRSMPRWGSTARSTSSI